MADYEVTEVETESIQVITEGDSATVEEVKPKLLLVKKKPEGAE